VSSPPWCRLSSGRHRHTVTPCHAYFPLIQDELAASTSFSNSASSHHLPSIAKTEVLNLHHRRQPPYSDRLTRTLHCYKNVMSILVTLHTTQSRLHFASSLAGAPPIAVVLFHRCPTLIAPLHNGTHSGELVDPLSLTEQLIIHVKIYFEITQYRAGLSTSIPMTQNPLALS
jgi:hypothetical protein